MLRTQATSSIRQPREALIPEAFALETVEQWALKKAAGFSVDQFRLMSFWRIDFAIQHVPGERKACYTVRLAQSDNYGLACGLTSSLGVVDGDASSQGADHDFVGLDSREVLKNEQFHDDLERTALIDLVAGQVSAPATEQVILDQTLRNKYVVKSRLFADETERVLKRKGLNAIKGNKPHVLVIGAMAGTISELIARGFKVAATDMSPDVIGRNLGGIAVCDARDNINLIKTADLTIITGMTLPNRTLPALVDVAKANNTSIMMWAITGKNLGHYYIENGVDCVISDPSPFFYLPGPVNIGIYRREV